MSTETPEERRSTVGDSLPSASLLAGSNGSRASANGNGSAPAASASSKGSSGNVSSVNPSASNLASSNPIVAENPPSQNASSATDDPTARKRRRNRRLLYGFVTFLLLIAGAGAIILTSYPNALVDLMIEPKVTSWVHDLLGDNYDVHFDGVKFTAGKDSLIITGLRVTDNGKGLRSAVNKLTNQSGGEQAPIESLMVDTIRVAGLDYWKLLSSGGLFAGNITIHSPKIYLRPGAFPKFASRNIMPSLIPIVSSKSIKVQDAEVYFSDESGATPRTAAERVERVWPSPNGLKVKDAQFELRDFYVDEDAAQHGSRTFFSKHATFSAADVSHADQNGVLDGTVASLSGDFIDSSLRLERVESQEPAKGVRRIEIDRVDLAGLDWGSLLARSGFNVARITVSQPRLYLQGNANLPKIPADQKIQLPSYVPKVRAATVTVTNGEIYGLLPHSRSINTLKRISLVLHDLALDQNAPLSGIATFFSRNANFGITGITNITTDAGDLRVADIKGTDKSVQVSGIRFQPSAKGVKLATLRSMSVQGINWEKLLMRKGLYAGSVVLRAPDIYLDEQDFQASSTNKTAPGQGIMDALATSRKFPLPDVVPIIAAGTVVVTNGGLHGIHLFDGAAEPKGPGDSLSGLSLSLKRFQFDRTGFLTHRGMLFSKAAEFSIGQATHFTPDGLYAMTEGGIRGNMGKHTFTLDSLLLRPLLIEDSFAARSQFRTDRLDVYAPQVAISGFDYQKMVTGRGLFCDSIFIENAKFDIYGDKRLPSKVSTGPSEYPHEAFQHITTLLGVKSVIVKNALFSFRERWPVGTEPGKLTLNEINATIGPISNDTSLVAASTPTNVSGDLRIMGAGFFKYNVDYSLMDPRMKLQLHGEIDSMNASLFNEYLIHAEPFKLTGGLIESSQIEMHIDDSLMNGLILPLYDNLRVEFFKFDGFPPGFFSMMANWFFMRGHNSIVKDHPPHSATIATKISRSDPFFWSLWYPVRNAVSSVVGIPDWIW